MSLGFDGIADEVQAFLAGSYAEYSRRGGSEVPGWAWLNLAAHASGDALAAAGRCAAALDGEAPATWAQVQGVLARATLAACDGDVGLLQREVLVPLELALAGRTAPLSPRRLVEVVCEALYGTSVGERAR